MITDCFAAGSFHNPAILITNCFLYCLFSLFFYDLSTVNPRQIHNASIAKAVI